MPKPAPSSNGNWPMFPIEAFKNTLAKAESIFERHAIAFHLTGGITSVLYGEPRMTQDIDIVVANQMIARELPAFVDSLELSDFLYDVPSIHRAVDEYGMFQLFDKVEAIKLDLYPRELVPGELQRSVPAEIFAGVHLPVASRADAAVSKLLWISQGSHKSRRDLRSIFRTSAASDQNLIRQLAAQVNLSALLDDVLAEPDELD
jgi:hypothetical protein